MLQQAISGNCFTCTVLKTEGLDASIFLHRMLTTDTFYKVQVELRHVQIPTLLGITTLQIGNQVLST